MDKRLEELIKENNELDVRIRKLEKFTTIFVLLMLTISCFCWSTGIIEFNFGGTMMVFSFMWWSFIQGMQFSRRHGKFLTSLGIKQYEE